MPAATVTRLNPYIGPRSFQRGEQFYGRTKETLDLLDLLIAERIVLLYSPSGAGKTSLIQAALVPALEAEGFFVHPPLRVSALPPAAEAATLAVEQQGGEGAADGVAVVNGRTNRYILSLILSLEEALPAEQQRP